VFLVLLVFLVSLAHAPLRFLPSPPLPYLSFPFFLQMIAYNIRTGPRSKPAYMTADEWEREYGDDTRPARTDEGNGLPLLPVPILGFQGLGDRMDNDAKQADAYITAADTGLVSLERLRQACAAAQMRVESSKASFLRQRSRLLLVAQKVDLLLTRGKPANQQEAKLAADLEAIYTKLNKTQNVLHRVEELQRTIRMREEARALNGGGGGRPGANGGFGGGLGASVDLTNPRNQELLKDSLAIIHDQIDKLRSTLERDRRHIEVARKEIGATQRLISSSAATGNGAAMGGGAARAYY
jgi:hypothetical protein